MQQVTIQFSADELRELAKQLSLARCFLINCEYDNAEMADTILSRVCAIGMAETPESDAYRHGGFKEPIFMPSLELDAEAEPLIELYNDYVLEEYLPYSLSDRDFREQYNTLDPEIILSDPDLLAALKAIQKKYIDEFERYGVMHLRLDEPE
jgi:hypothetical protein